MSSDESSGVINPKPLPALNHATLPFCIKLSFLTNNYFEVGATFHLEKRGKHTCVKDLNSFKSGRDCVPLLHKLVKSENIENPPKKQSNKAGHTKISK